MKPDHEINGKYFAEAIVDFSEHGNDEKILEFKNFFWIVSENSTPQSLPLGKCFVELEKINLSRFEYRIKLHEGKAIVLTELPEEEKRFGYKIPNERNWTEDFSHENGKYMNICKSCGNEFLGHKRRYICKICGIRPEAKHTIGNQLAKTVYSKYWAKWANENYSAKVEPIDVEEVWHEWFGEAMEEYYRVKSEGLFTYKDMSQCWAAAYDKALPMQVLNGDKNVKVGNGSVSQTQFRNWLESKKK